MGKGASGGKADGQTAQRGSGSVKMITSSTSWAEYAPEALALLEIRPKTRHEYAAIIKKTLPYIGNLPLKSLSAQALERMYADMRQSVSATSIRDYNRCVSSLLSAAVRWDVLPTNPAQRCKLPRQHHTSAACLSADDAQLLVASLADAPPHYARPVLFALLSGLRRGELCGMQWQDISGNILQVSRTVNYLPGRGLYIGAPKTPQSARALHLSDTACQLLQSARAEAAASGHLSPWCWIMPSGGQLHPDTLGNWFRRWCDIHNLPQVHLHTLRHTHASLMLAAGAPLPAISARLGHSQISTTTDIYLHNVRQTADAEAADELDNILLG